MIKGKKNSFGFTLTELLIVISIITFLAVLITVYLRTQVLKGNDAKRKGDMHDIQVAVEEYEKDNDCYPLPSLVVCNPGDGLKPYINKVPCDPQTKASYFYDYEDSLCPSWYKIYTNLENVKDKDIPGLIGPGNYFNYYVSSPNAPGESVIPLPSGSSGSGGSGSGGGDQKPVTGYYGCLSGICSAISWDPARPGPECDPNFQNSTCYGQCANPELECQKWK